MIAAKDEGIAGALQHCLHTAAIGLDACSARIVKPSAVNRAPEVCIELEIGAAPLLAHRPKDVCQVRLRVRMRAVERVPGPAAPAAKRDPIRPQRLAAVVAHEPVRMLLEDA